MSSSRGKNLLSAGSKKVTVNGELSEFLKNMLVFNPYSPDTIVKDYDLGLPGSGILIWHINEPEIDLNSGINNNSNNKSVYIEEADGAIDIGFESYAMFSNADPTNGTKWDFWYMGNDAYYYTNNNDEICVNPETYEILDEYTYQTQCILNGGIWIKPVIFDKFSNPSSDLSDGSESFFSFEILFIGLI